VKIKALMYHSIDIPNKNANLKSLFVKPLEFKKQMLTLKLLGYKFSTLENLSKKSVILTFDDGFKNFIENAYPILKKLKATAYIFIPVSFIGKYNVWDYKKLNVKIPVMNWSDLQFLVKEGFIIGSHTMTHPFLTKIPLKDAKREIEFSKKFLEDNLGIEINTFCYPYGDYNKKIVSLVKNAGYKYAFTTKKGNLNFLENPFEINRVFISGNKVISLPSFIKKVILR